MNEQEIKNIAKEYGRRRTNNQHWQQRFAREAEDMLYWLSDTHYFVPINVVQSKQMAIALSTDPNRDEKLDLIRYFF